MKFAFAGPKLPITLRVCRTLVWTQAVFVMLAGAFVVFAATVFGNENEIPFHGDTLTGGRAVALGVVYIVVGLVLAYLGVALGRLASWARNAIVCAQVFLAILLLFRSFDLSVSTLINVVLYVAIVVLIFAPETRRAFDTPRATAAPGTPGTA